MKKLIFIVLTLIILISGSQLFANTSLSGAYGYFTMPITSTPARGEIRINSGYIFTPGNFYVSLNTSLIKNWELSAGKEILVGGNNGIGATPFVVGSKYMFYSKGGFRAAGGLQVEILGDEAGVDGVDDLFDRHCAGEDSVAESGYQKGQKGMEFQASGREDDKNYRCSEKNYKPHKTIPLVYIVSY